MLGIGNLKKMVKFSMDFTKQMFESAKDGYQLTDLFAFVDEFAQLPGIVKNWQATIAEFKELDADERQELYDYIVEEFDIPNDKVEAFVEAALAQVISLVSLYEQWKALKK